MVTVTTGQSLALSLRFVEGLVDVLVKEVVGFVALPFPLFRGFTPFPLPIGPLPFPPEVTLRTRGFALALVLITTVGCCNKTLCSAVVTIKSLQIFVLLSVSPF